MSSNRSRQPIPSGPGFQNLLLRDALRRVEDSDNDSIGSDGGFPQDSDAELGHDHQLSDLATLMNNYEWQSDVFERLRQQLSSDDPSLHGKAAIELRGLLSTTRETVFSLAENVLEYGLEVFLMRMMVDGTYDSSARRHAAFCVTNVAAGSEAQTTQLVRSGVVPALLTLLLDSDNSLKRQAIFALANIAGNTNEDRIAIAAQSEYWQLARNAMFLCGSASRVEELAAWGFRNICILGGPRLVDLQPGLKIFLDLLYQEVSQDSYGKGANTLRFAMESLVAVMRYRQGMELVHHQDTCGRLQLEVVRQQLKLWTMYVARYSTDPFTRAHALEATWRLFEFALFGDPETQIAARLDESQLSQAVSLINGILKRSLCYSALNRIYACKIASLIAIQYSYGALLMCSPSTKQVERSTGRKKDFCKGQPVPPIAAANMVQLRWEQDELMTNEDIHDDVDEAASTIEVCQRLFYDHDKLQDHWSREMAGRTFCSILGGLPANAAVYFVRPAVFVMIMDVLELAHQSELWARETAETSGASLANFDDAERVAAAKRDSQTDELNGEGVATYQPDARVLLSPTALQAAVKSLEVLITAGEVLRHVSDGGFRPNPALEALDGFDGWERLRRIHYMTPDCMESRQTLMSGELVNRGDANETAVLQYLLSGLLDGVTTFQPNLV